MKASHHDISANVGDGVSIRLPRLRFEVSQRQAERLRDVLCEVLPRGTRRYLLCMWDHTDPELSGPFDGEQDRMESAADYQRAHGDGNGAYYVDVNEGAVSVRVVPDADMVMPTKPLPKPIVRVPVHVGDRVLDPSDGQWREVMSIDPCGTVNMRDGGCMSVAECEAAEKRLPSEPLPTKRCAVSTCFATGERFGLPVCDYHHEHGEDDEPCPACDIAAAQGIDS